MAFKPLQYKGYRHSDCKIPIKLLYKEITDNKPIKVGIARFIGMKGRNVQNTIKK